ncbi:MAG: hypothetical protein PUK59_07110 [Actinomycetaceae bacterium]|nr:hypothetical protein [Actinomycetaceae bacterium]MDY5854944.1 hypothetical protein [Arcanobacterium sp.]
MHAFMDGELLTAANLNTAYEQAIQTAKTYADSLANTSEKFITVNGMRYARSGILRLDQLGGWTTANDVYSYRRLNATVPVTLPPGYAVKYEVVFSEHACIIAGGDMWNNNASGKQSNAYIFRFWNSTNPESTLILRWEIYRRDN